MNQYYYFCTIGLVWIEVKTVIDVSNLSRMDYGRICAPLYLCGSNHLETKLQAARRYAVSQKMRQNETSINFVSLDLEYCIVKAGGM